VLIALFADVHANLEALDACLNHARSRGAQRFAFLGDFVGYGADARAVIEVIERHAAGGALVLKGNHDEAIDKSAGYFNDASQAALQWARDSLSSEQKRFLIALPLLAREGTVCYVHASAAAPERWDYIDSPAAAKRCTNATDACYTFCGHVHDQVLYFETAQGRMSEFRPYPGTAIPVRSHRRWVGIVGSVGQPRDRNPAAAYTLFDLGRQEVTFFRVPYDAAAAAAKIRACGLPASLAYRVELGI
jgi:diadenosine tetraphosphatase ApaH/serine/threonine PP2A family protein phosphatase